MPWEAAFWVGVALLSPIAAEVIWPRLSIRLGEQAEIAERFAPWAWGLIPAYLALITGAVPARDLGLTGHSPFAWFGGALICGALIGIAALLRWPKGDWPEPTRGVLDEPRWALYRGAGLLWIAGPAPGLLIGLGLSLLEWGIRFQPWKTRRGRDPRRWQAPPGTWETLLRMASSASIYTLTRNFWLTAIFQAALLSVIRRDIRESA